MNTHDDALNRFVVAQSLTYIVALSELRAGRKRSHWIWFILPQLRGLGQSRMSYEYGLTGKHEALLYLRHPLLGPRLVECVQTILAHKSLSASEILGEVDALKFCSCLTLFVTIAPEETCFAAALQAFYGGVPDPATIKLL